MLKPCNHCKTLIPANEYLKHLAEHKRESKRGRSSSSAWERTRQQVLRRAGGRCEGCGVAIAQQPYDWQAHHVNGNPADDRLDNLRALCGRCHRKLTPRGV